MNVETLMARNPRMPLELAQKLCNLKPQTKAEGRELIIAAFKRENSGNRKRLLAHIRENELTAPRGATCDQLEALMIAHIRKGK